MGGWDLRRNLREARARTNYILAPNDRVCPKLAELGKLFDSCLAETDTKIIVFSEWERMLELARDLCKREKIGYAWHTGSVPQHRRWAEIMTFKNDPACTRNFSARQGQNRSSGAGAPAGD
ncbi:MAG: hypothetical protein PHP98_07970 [Kiritimatiellae bacterium]|nr:hypothetical protein [Kiritimatiellia bacterium]